MPEIDLEKLYCYDPRMLMTAPGRFIIRVCRYVAIFVLTVASAAMILSGITNLMYSGALVALFLVDYAIHRNVPRRQIVPSMQRHLRRKEEMNIADYLTPETFMLVMEAIDYARIMRKDFSLVLLERIAKTAEVQEGLVRMNVKPEEFRAHVSAVLKKSADVKLQKTELLVAVVGFVKYAFINALNLGERAIYPHNLFAALFSVKSDDLNTLFTYFEFEASDLEHALLLGKLNHQRSGLQRFSVDMARPQRVIKVRAMNRAWTARPTPTLDTCSTDLTALARAGGTGFLVGHETELRRLTDVLARPAKGSALLVGDPGTGKATIVGHLARLMFEDQVPSALFDKRLVELSIGSLVAGLEPSKMQAKVKKIIEEIIRAGNVILYIPDLHNLLKTSGGDDLNAGDIFVPYITRGSFQIVGSTGTRDYKHVIEPNTDFCTAFEVIRVAEVSEDEAARILIAGTISLERSYRITTSYKAIKKAVSLARKYAREKPLPSSAEDILKEALADAHERGAKWLTEEDIVSTVERKINVPIHDATKEEAEKLLNIEGEIKRRLIDQDEAAGTVARALREYRSGLTRVGGPIASFLFVGPTGVGKTELSKILAEVQFGSEKAMTRFDMSEFQEKASIERLLGSNDGAITGQLTEAIRLKPFSLLLLDELEKAHPDILNIFLQVLDDGRLTDGTGTVIDFTNTIIIATSNAHSDFIKAQTEHGKTSTDIARDLKPMLTTYFRPEFLNRFSAIVVFRTLSLAGITKIAVLNLEALGKILEETHSIHLLADEKAVRALATLGYDPVFGARPLRAVLSDKIKSKLATAILQGEVGRGERIRLTYENNDFVIFKDAQKSAQE
jgi:ATP-dependent Clp protease ATP-binding subunit ClpC